MLDDIFCRTGTSAPTMVGRRLDLVERLEFKFDQENSVLEVMVVVMVEVILAIMKSWRLEMHNGGEIVGSVREAGVDL